MTDLADITVAVLGGTGRRAEDWHVAGPRPGSRS